MLLIAVLLGVAVPLQAEGSPSGAAPKTKSDQAAPAAPGKEQEQPNIPGLVIPRAKGGFLGLLIENGNFKLSFYDDERKPVAADVARANARWPVHYSVYDERAVLNPSADGKALTSSKFVRPPYQFKLYLTLITEGSSDAPESYVLDFHQ